MVSVMDGGDGRGDEAGELRIGKRSCVALELGPGATRNFQGEQVAVREPAKRTVARTSVATAVVVKVGRDGLALVDSARAFVPASKQTRKPAVERRSTSERMATSIVPPAGQDEELRVP